MTCVQFSIIIPTLNEEDYLPNLLSNLSAQSFKDFEVIVVDGNSEDKTIEVAKSFEKKLFSLRILNSPKRNVSFQRNMGAKTSKANWIIFMDADNRLPNYFLEGVSYRIHLTKPDIFTCWLEIESRVKADEAIARALNIGVELIKIAKNPGAMGAMIGIDKKGFRKIGGFNEKIGFAEDWDFVKRAFDKGLVFKIFRDPKYTYSLRQLERGGKLASFRRLANVYLKFIAGLPIDQVKDYPMGGGFVKTEFNFFDKIRESTKKLSKKPKFLKKIQSLIDSFDNGY